MVSGLDNCSMTVEADVVCLHTVPPSILSEYSHQSVELSTAVEWIDPC